MAARSAAPRSITRIAVAPPSSAVEATGAGVAVPHGGTGAALIHRVASERLAEAADAGDLYAIVDACAGPLALDLVAAAPAGTAACLYLGAAARLYGDKAPYLIRADRALIARLRDGFRDAPWGCFVVSSAGWDRVRRHLRHLLRVTSPEGEIWLFRYYDPRLLPTFLRHATPAELDQVFGPVEAFALVDAAGDAFAAYRDPATVRAAPRRAVGERYRLSVAQVAAFRRAQLGDRLIATFADSAQSAYRDPANDDVLVRQPDGGTMRLGFDRNGFVGGVTSALGRRWLLDSRADGKLSELKTPSGMTLTLGYDAAGRVERVDRDGRERFRARHDEHGRLEEARFADGSHTRIAYAARGAAGAVDPRGELVAAREDRNGHVERYDYGANGALSAITDGAGRRTGIVHDAGTRPDATLFADGSREAYRYDPAGHLQQVVRSDGHALDVTCDAGGRPLSLAAADGATAEFAYDDAGRLVGARNAEADLSWRYDAQGRLVEERHGDAAIGYHYDATGLVGLTYPTGETIHYRRDLDQRLVELTDWQGQSYRIDYADHDAAWRLSAPDGTRTTAWQNPAGLTTATRDEVGDVAHCGATYLYDDDDRLRTRSDSRLGAVHYHYDAEGQLTGFADRSGAQQRFSYDGAGNRIVGPDGLAAVDALNRIETYGSERFRHDGRGNLIERAGAGHTWRYRYDGFDRLILAEDDTGCRVHFGYDALGRRLWKRAATQAGETIVRFVWAGEQVVREVTETIAGWDGGAAVSTRDYLYWPQSYVPLLLREGGTIYRYHCDPAGIPRRLTAPGGTIVWEADADPFGAVRLTVAQIAQPWRLPGQYHDVELGLHYNRFRYYDPALGRYLSRDPVGLAGGLNLYLYAGNDPVNRADPLGLWWKAALSVVAAVAVAAVVVALAPVAAPALLVAVVAGAAAGAVGFGLNEALNEEHFCASCIALAAAKGALIGAAAATPFLLLPEAAGLGLLAAADAASGAISYLGSWALTPGMPWSWKDFAGSAALGVVVGPFARYAGSKLSPRVPPATERPVGSVEETPANVHDPAATPDPVEARAPTADEAPAEAPPARNGSTYSERIAQTPVSNGSWSGVRGESTFVSTHPDVVPIMGEDGISYTNAYPDFSPVSAGDVEIPSMSTSRSSNFAQADKALAEQTGVTPSQVKAWRTANKYTWHEVQDLKTMQLVPSPVNAKFGHLGGVGEIKAGATKP
jgi:RHS repeat-associated protein